MSEDLQSLLERINRDGVEKAQAEAAKIVSEAKAEAAKIVKEAQELATATKAESERVAADNAARAAETIRQSARDVLREVEDAVTALFKRLLAENVERALADEKVLADIASKVVSSFATTGDIEVSAAGKFVSALKASLASRHEVKVVTDETLGSGFSVKTDGGRVEHSFKGAVVAEELSRRLRPELAKLVRG